ncbi:MAG TPA: GDSL-type esterase/lipase family protein [Streptomyces sp.]|uniref:GDSL-type esterase/lipase family protein n=1 Tax=Streptomyces sp. TaxID=1931 RepID=UPI002BF7E6C1|nr:GDSL-type esterase/lipase family protein [Streptomyces sp.]HWU12337.1 GDSL-type esterase/lipase family protein [Streptomyces sp.]
MRLTTKTGTLAATGVLLASLTASAPAFGAGGTVGAPGGQAWHTAWAQSQQGLASASLTDQTVRSIARLSQGGDAVRVRIQNKFANGPLTIGRGAVAISAGGPATRPGTTRPLAFRGQRGVTVPAGGEVWSDPVSLGTTPQTDLAVSLHVPGTIRPGEHSVSWRGNYLTEPGSGDHVGDTGATAYTQTTYATYLVSAVDVRNPRVKGTIVAYGSSVVDGAGSTDCGPGCKPPSTDNRWTDVLARRIVRELPADRQLAVANAGVNGTTASAHCPGTPSSVAGLDAGARLERDVLALHGVTGVIFFYGTNDLQHGCTSQQVIAAHRESIARLHRAGIEVYVVPTTPRPIYTDRMNRYRWDVGTYLRNQGSCGGACDGVIDFDHVIKDPVAPNSIDKRYDIGDGIHVNIAGHRAQAETVSLPLLAASSRR